MSGFRTRAEAQDALDRYKRDHDHGIAVERHADTLGPYVDGWLAGRAVAGLRPATIHNYRASLERHVIPVLGQRKVQSLRSVDFNRLYKGTMEGVDGRPPVSARTTRLAHTIIRKVLDDARREGLIGHNPTDDATAPSALASRPPEIPTWTPDELRTFL